MKCEICGKGPADGTTIHRTNKKGVKGIWRCWKCLTVEQASKVDPEVLDIANIINPTRPR